ncbi:MAG: hypothetical protein HYX24_00540 [Candidatus Aenigmarchaeota archaeon]|nr:hypothetical protein [Candidatus Aenigmarchaeota archaeon]
MESRRKGDLAIEYAGKFILLAISIAVIMAFIWHLYITNKDKNPVPTKTPTVAADTIKQDEFSAKQIARYIEGCWSYAVSGVTKDALCYVLIGKMNANNNTVMAAIPADIRKRVVIKADFSSPSLSISLDNSGNMVVVR